MDKALLRNLFIGCLSLLVCGCADQATEAASPTTLSSVNPDIAAVGKLPPLLQLTGTGFLASSSVEWNGQARATTFISSTELQALLEDPDVSSIGVSALTVVNSAPRVTSNAVLFTVANPVPVLDSLSPTSAPYASVGVTLKVTGAGFVPTSTVLWNGISVPTQYFSETALFAQIPSTNLAAVGAATVAVQQAEPGGGTSRALPFTILGTYVTSQVAQPANDMAWDPVTGLIYVSVPSSAQSYGNSIIALDPDAGTVAVSQFLGNEPTKLALSDDGQFIYVGLNGAGSVERLTLPALTLSLEYSLGSDPLFGSYTAGDIQVAPGAPHTTAVSLFANVEPAAQGGIVIFDDGAPRQTRADSGGGSRNFASIQWGTDATQLYSANTESTSYDFYRLSVGAAGVTLLADYPNVELNIFQRILFDQGTHLIYSDNGVAIYPTTSEEAGTFVFAGQMANFLDPYSNFVWMVPDSSIDRAFFLTPGCRNSFLAVPCPANSGFVLQVFDLSRYTLLSSVLLPQMLGTPLQFIRWGPRGLAIATSAGYIYLVSGGLIDGNP